MHYTVVRADSSLHPANERARDELQSIAISHWLSANLESALVVILPHNQKVVLLKLCIIIGPLICEHNEMIIKIN